MSNEISMTNKHDSPAPPYSTVEPGQNSQANIQNGAAYPVNHQNHEHAPYQNEAQHHTNGTKPIHSVPNVPVEPTASVTPLKLLREQPAYIDCPCCRSRQKTRPEEKDSGMTW
ncbi:uncharacterized protein K489DRAFT_2759 [Dissoconium aciculare CBS 342.82]|uniref:LITAF domain-containing protein n=1 Tax=Dissoconium aciculare CBS 342.82 TaxID=1314786 RepID=A0A6J3MG72_9PEZI|nr:uncharacterized protein K489DRAFT_2759 [Dissoconium aciculare CBS 342.82]KAF1826971.1 hypothetical protein K489DRAFT_2759 [Dissoconium aciculare CBS 342.82]